jgi:Transposase DDE domain group 1
LFPGCGYVRTIASERSPPDEQSGQYRLGDGGQHPTAKQHLSRSTVPPIHSPKGNAATSWKTARRVAAKVEFHCGELFRRVGFIVTNLSLPSRAVVRFYNKRGAAEQWIKEGKQATHWTRLSCHRFRANEARLQLSPAGLQLGQSVAPSGAAEKNRRLVADELAAAAGENRRTPNQARPVLLAATGGESPHAAAVWEHAAQDRGAAITSRIDEP